MSKKSNQNYDDYEDDYDPDAELGRMFDDDTDPDEMGGDQFFHD